jgi:hypothetical protein
MIRVVELPLDNELRDDRLAGHSEFCHRKRPTFGSIHAMTLSFQDFDIKGT